MALIDDLQVLADFGVFNEDAISRLAGIARLIKDQSGGGSGTPVARKRGPGRPPKAAGQRAARGKFEVEKDELSKMRQGGMTAKAIAEKYGVSTATVNLRLKKFGLTTPRKAHAGKKAPEKKQAKE